MECAYIGCARRRWNQRGLCRGHLAQHTRGEHFRPLVCDTCGGGVYALNLCRVHYQRTTDRPTVTLPADPILAHIRLRGIPEDRRLRQTYDRARTTGHVTINAADQLACELGMHPIEVWGDAWFEGVAA